MARNTRTFSDLDFNFLLHPKSKDVVSKYDEEAIKQSIRNLIQTKNYERPFRSEIGSQISSLLFEPISPILSTMIEKSIADVILNYEPRVDLLSVKIAFSPANNYVYATIVFKIKNTQTPVSVNLILERTR